MLDGVTTPCDKVMRDVNNGTGVPCRDNYCGPRLSTINGEKVWGINSGGAGYWFSDGKSSEYLFFDDLRYGSLVDGLTAHLRAAQGSKKKKRARVPQKQPTVAQPTVGVDIGGGAGIFRKAAPQNPQEPSLFQRIKRIICRPIPSGRTYGVSGGLGLINSVIGGGEIVVNYNTGQMSAFAFTGAQIGWGGGIQGGAHSGFVYGLNDSNSNYSGGFSGFNLVGGAGASGALSSGGVTGGGWIPNAKVIAAGPAVGTSLLGPTGGFTLTQYSKPRQLFKNPFGLSKEDIAFYLARQACK